MAVDSNTIYCSIRNGKIITVDRQTYRVDEFIVSESSMWSIKTYDSYLVSGTKLFKISMRNFEIESLIKNVHKKMFDCAGIYGYMLVTVSYPCSEIGFWNKDTLEKIKVINIPLKLSGRTHIENNFMYISSRNIFGINKIKLNG